MWLVLALSAYFLFAISNLIDKHLLSSGPIKPKVYTFYVGTLSVLVILLIPFVDFAFPSLPILLLALLTGAVFILGLWAFYSGLKRFEASRILTTLRPAWPSLMGVLLFSMHSIKYSASSSNASVLSTRGVHMSPAR